MDVYGFHIIVCDGHGVVEKRSLSITEAWTNPGQGRTGNPSVRLFRLLLSLVILRNEDAERHLIS